MGAPRAENSAKILEIAGSVGYLRRAALAALNACVIALHSEVRLRATGVCVRENGRERERESACARDVERERRQKETEEKGEREGEREREREKERETESERAREREKES